jgi:hypothetical protein
MKVSSPIGEYDYEVKHVGFHRGRIEVVGSLGQWETTMAIEPSDWLVFARRAAPAIAVIGALGLTLRASRKWSAER